MKQFLFPHLLGVNVPLLHRVSSEPDGTLQQSTMQTPGLVVAREQVNNNSSEESGFLLCHGLQQCLSVGVLLLIVVTSVQCWYEI